MLTRRLPGDGNILGGDAGLRGTLDRALRVAPTQVPILVTGESGTGKELLARLLHQAGPSPTGPLVTVNCGALPRELAESELFGHERGAFTGAGVRRIGWFEEAQGGTLVLDEIGELALDLQPKLLRVLETGRLRRVGGQGEVPLRVRVVSMTLRDLGAELRRGTFRADLYHRLAGVELHLPPLRDRAGDVEILARHFLAEVEAETGPRTLGSDALAALRAHPWPGNVRELRNVVRRAALLAPGTHIDAAGLDLRTPGTAWNEGSGEARTAEAGEPPAEGLRLREGSTAPLPTAAQPAPSGEVEGVLSLHGRTWEDIQRAVLAYALRVAGGSRRKAARALGVSRSTLAEKVKRLGVMVAV